MCVGEKRNASRISIGQPKGKRQLGRRWSRWNNDIKINLKEKGGEIGFIWPPFIYTVMTLRFPLNKEFLYT